MVVTEENVKRVKDYYNRLVEERETMASMKEHYEKLEQKKRKLELDLKVQVYCNIQKEMNEILEAGAFSHEPLEDGYILSKAAVEVCGDDQTNHIYVYMGTYGYDGDDDIVHGRGAVEFADDNPNFEWKAYKNIELRYSDATIQVGKSDFRNFEADNIILHAPKGEFPDLFYKKVRKVFFEALVHFGQEAAVEKVKMEFGSTISESMGSPLVKK